MAILQLTDANMRPLLVNTDQVLFVGPGDAAGHLAVVLNMPTNNGPMAITVANTLEQILERWEAALEPKPTLFEMAGPRD